MHLHFEPLSRQYPKRYRQLKRMTKQELIEEGRKTGWFEFTPEMAKQDMIEELLAKEAEYDN